ncbi:hypothetical protein SRB5_18130 [Streptomyces sp. RB5]|uniref:Integral membrane protein n=1 Tax=Streptomyces smaragdinus TaxID=2585196 RepID=A0A7K0CG37_9ACTN|nr:hypothetical protein [Streptomyces smaragdinus]MQY11694.1 hypothetical protein [Streptomyces smaragdinus]
MPIDEKTTTTGRPDRKRPGPALELLVHGVGGTTPERMLGDPRTVLVTGDRTAGIYRRRDDERGERRSSIAEPVPEAYCWSNLTSGNGSRALWLLLLPFMVANLAHWARPSAPAGHRGQHVYDVLVRLLALSLTVLLVGAAAEVTMDLIAWQCAGDTHCTANKSWLAFMSDGGWWAAPGRRLVVGATVPALLTGLLWWLSHRTWSAYESASPPPGAGTGDGAASGAERPVLSLPGFWYGRRLVARLRAAHTAAGLLTPASALWAAAAAADSGGTLAALGRVLAVPLLAGWAAVVYVVCRRGRCEAELDRGDDRWAVRTLPAFALGVLLLTAVHTAWSRPGWTGDGHLPGTGLFGVLAAAQGVLIAALAVTAWRLQRTAGGEAPPVLKGLAGPVVAMLACAVAGVFSGGLAQRLADWLDRGATPGEGALAGPPVELSWQATVIPLVLLTVLALALLAAARSWRLRKQIVTEVPGMYADEDPSPLEHPNKPRTLSIAGAVSRAQLTDFGPTVLGTAALIVLLLGGGAVAGAWITGEVPGAAARGGPGPLPALAQTGQALGSWLMGAGFVLLLTMGRRAYKDASARRSIGILWDVGTFWPRAAHPFAPPCYAERAVPDLTWRITKWTEAHPGGRLVVSGHSQGSVLAAAAVWQLAPGDRGRVALLTYGSPLHRLYGRWFPGYFGPGRLAALHGDVDTWTNLWRQTDPIGGPVGLPDGHGSEVDRGPLKDPLCYGRTAERPLPSPILGHSDYQADPVFDAERRELLGRLASVPVQRGAAVSRPPADPPDAAG